MVVRKNCDEGCVLHPGTPGATGTGNPCGSCPHNPGAYGEADYIADNYGHCALGAGCECLKPRNPWLGRACLNWRPVAAATLDELPASWGPR